MTTDTDVLTEAERAELAELVGALPSDVDQPSAAARVLRQRWGLLPGDYWPAMRRLELVERAVTDRRRRAAIMERR